jgi:hypothetical protein
MKFGMGALPLGTPQNHTFECPTTGNNEMADEEIKEVGPTVGQ